MIETYKINNFNWYDIVQLDEENFWPLIWKYNVDTTIANTFLKQEIQDKVIHLNSNILLTLSIPEPQKGLKCMAKSTTYDSSLFDGLTVESYSNDKNWWSKAEMKQILWAGKIGAIVHYDEENCNQIEEFYQNKYGKNLLFICEDKKLKKYRHF